MTRRWQDVRAESGLNKDRVTADQERMLAEVRAVVAMSSAPSISRSLSEKEEIGSSSLPEHTPR